MTPEIRSFAWQTVERVFADLHIAVGTPFPVLVGFEVKQEDVIPYLRTELGREDLEITRIVKKAWPFGRRWLVAARSKPQRIARADVERWLDGVEALLANYDAVVVTWPRPTPNQRLQLSGAAQ